MKNKGILIAGVLGLGALTLVKAKSKEPEISEIPCPASVYCVEQGGISEIRNNPDTSQYGVCIFPDGSECDEWAFYYGECKKGDSL